MSGGISSGGSGGSGGSSGGSGGITGATRLLAVIGHPVNHSLSPQIHNRFAASLNLPYAYLAFDVTPETLSDFMAAARTLNIAGFNVTMPLKSLILPHLDEIAASADLYGAVNTVVYQDGKFSGHNTDGQGFLLSLASAGLEAAKANALILGAGGAARAVAMALLQQGAQVRLACRRQSTALPLEGAVYCPWSEIGNTIETAGCNLLINATPLGMEGTSPSGGQNESGGDFTDLSFLDILQPGALVYDLIYAPRETFLLRQAKAKGFAVMNGLAHLVCQAALSFEHFTGRAPDPNIIEELIASL